GLVFFSRLGVVGYFAGQVIFRATAPVAEFSDGRRCACPTMTTLASIAMRSLYNRCSVELLIQMDAANLRSVPLFASLDSKATAELGEYLTIHDYPKSATIFRNGDPGDAMYLIDVDKLRISITDATVRDVTLAA